MGSETEQQSAGVVAVPVYHDGRLGHDFFVGGVKVGGVVSSTVREGAKEATTATIEVYLVGYDEKKYNGMDLRSLNSFTVSEQS